MPAQLEILTRKVLVDQSSPVVYTSEPMYWGMYKRADLYLEVHGLGLSTSTPTIALSVEGATEPGENANWQTISAPTAYPDPTALTAKGVAKYVRQDLYPYVRVKVTISGTADLIAEVSVNGTLHTAE